MDDNFEKRAYERRNCSALIAVSYFNQTGSYDAMMLNYCDGGICFQSNLSIPTGATICIRLKESQPHDALKDNGGGLRCMSIAEVKWCNELPIADSTAYGIGVKYQAPVY